MNGPLMYLDSSAVIKRYVKEPGSGLVRELFLRMYSGECRLSYSIWNVGEVLGVLDRARRIGRLDEEGYKVARRRFILETRRLTRLGLVYLVPVRVRILVESWKLLEKHHLYIADALQIATARYVNATEFLTGDERLHETASNEGLNSTCVS
ncbi:type II toxin-antitoxin system VapC family toxin [Candidatus Bathyarchaeota archaeon]|nr:type II toxin-antitoxin system VapC family toxin [Candidatus Bathyarchaeota archaeon]